MDLERRSCRPAGPRLSSGRHLGDADGRRARSTSRSRVPTRRGTPLGRDEVRSRSRSTPRPTITTTSLPDGTAGSAYSQTLAASGGTAPLAWSISSGSLPPGLALNPGTGVISGTPTTAGTFAFTAMVTDAAGASDTQALSIDVAIAIAPTSLPGATVRQELLPDADRERRHRAPARRGASRAGSLPSGLAAGPVHRASLAARRPRPARQLHRLGATDSGTGTGSRSYTLVVNSTPSITTTSLPAASVGTAYSTTLAATGGTCAADLERRERTPFRPGSVSTPRPASSRVRPRPRELRASRSG